ncbi:protein of unknown function [Mariniphaga anaerophila]|uniref:DUF5063 domain-containing protein n=1 Tax=Mariniphaga anaerophila TaxID=1484053 RepID=A0A1M4THP7_9BACT|nr:DUF5063 domain-containing protein [Mariniphaga anaerophila]SHE43966.1 protein of unknown function [Mariniphaga anaerophila]
MSEVDLHSLVFSKNVVEFVTVANEYCGLIEKVGHIPTEQNIKSLQKVLPLLYLKAALLPKTEKLLEDNLEKYVSELDYNIWQQRWLEALGEHDSYYEVFDPDIQFGEEMVTASISECLLDIYQDLKDFLNAYSLGNEEIMNDALYDCVSHFEDFWGQRLVNVLRPLHKLITEGIEFNADGGAKNDDKIEPGKGNPEWLDRFWGTHSDEE